MRLGVLDVGSNTVHLLVVDAHPGAQPLAAHSTRRLLRLAEHLTPDGAVDAAGVAALTDAVTAAAAAAEDAGVEELLAFATSAVREAVNGEDVLDHVEERTGVRLQVLPGTAEADLTFLAVRRWFGWSAGRLLVLDIGGGSLEVAAGLDETPDVSFSLPLGAGRLTRDRLAGDPPAADAVREVRRHVRQQIASRVRDVTRAGTPDRVVVTSKTFRSLARLTGAAPAEAGPAVRRVLRREDLSPWVPRLAGMTCEQRAGLPGVSAERAPQLLAGALVAEAAFELLGVEEALVGPWALREGLILRRLDAITVQGADVRVAS
ncbi:exopolyphosphatase [Kineococcus rhizosphaerae]|uniref:Ppx/GppA phosphatase n=1 Tax=Kineococcus rhizosphaerae TaxID=559628 RepID=A0A2T0R5F6_9ACTN|nr:exopolyphosphatase [Kineococcus rhizosphaerae]PRY15989.1 Ppx/GppA phosphatase [Kineococcus rhizosphaerae]